jgi:hypothetical protein
VGSLHANVLGRHATLLQKIIVLPTGEYNFNERCYLG